MTDTEELIKQNDSRAFNYKPLKTVFDYMKRNEIR